MNGFGRICHRVVHWQLWDDGRRARLKGAFMRWRWTLLGYTLSMAVIVLYDVTVGDATWFGTSGVVGLCAVVGWWRVSCSMTVALPS